MYSKNVSEYIACYATLCYAIYIIVPWVKLSCFTRYISLQNTFFRQKFLNSSFAQIIMISKAFIIKHMDINSVFEV